MCLFRSFFDNNYNLSLKNEKKMVLKTKRLTLIPLSLCQLELWILDNSRLERELNCTYCAQPVTGFFYDIVKRQINIANKDKKIYYFIHFGLLC